MKKFIENPSKFLFAVLILSLPFSPLKFFLFGVPLYVPEILTLIVWAVITWAFFQNKITLLRPDKYIVFSIFVLLVGVILSLFSNPVTMTGLGMLKTWFIFPILSMLAFLQIPRHASEKRFYLYVWLIMTVGVAAVALAYLISGDLTFDGRLQAFYTSPNFLSIMLAPGVLIAAYFLVISPVVKNKLLFSSFLSLLLVLIFFTRSYAVWLALGAAGAFFYGMRLYKTGEIKKGIAATVVVIAIVLGFFLLEKETDKWQSLMAIDERSSIASRVMIWKASVKMIENTSPIGLGLGRFQETYLSYQQYFPPYLEWAVPQPHNLYLAFLLQAGLIGLSGFLWIVWICLRALWRRLRSADHATASLLIALFILYGVYGVFDTPYFKTDLAFLFWLLVALSAAPWEKK